MDRFGPRRTLTGVVLLQRVTDTHSTMLFAGAIGLGQGLLMSVYTTIWVRYYGRAHLGKIRGSIATFGVASSSLGPFAMGFAYDWFGGYTEILWAFLCIVVVMVFLGLLATRPALPKGDRG